MLGLVAVIVGMVFSEVDFKVNLLSMAHPNQTCNFTRVVRHYSDGIGNARALRVRGVSERLSCTALGRVLGSLPYFYKL